MYLRIGSALQRNTAYTLLKKNYANGSLQERRHPEAWNGIWNEKKNNERTVTMFPLKKILCPVDFSPSSYEGLRTAVELARTYSAELILINVIQPVEPVAAPGVPAGYSLQEYYEEMGSAARKSFEEIVENRVPRGMAVRSKVLEGQPADEIIREAEQEKIDLIVTATHGWTGWRRFFFGSVAERVVRLSPCPVLTVPAQHDES